MLNETLILLLQLHNALSLLLKDLQELMLLLLNLCALGSSRVLDLISAAWHFFQDLMVGHDCKPVRSDSVLHQSRRFSRLTIHWSPIYKLDFADGVLHWGIWLVHVWVTALQICPWTVIVNFLADCLEILLTALLACRILRAFKAACRLLITPFNARVIIFFFLDLLWAIDVQRWPILGRLQLNHVLTLPLV